MSAETAVGTRASGPLAPPAYRWRFAHLAALWGFGVSQPVFSMLKGNPEFLVVRGSTREDVVVFAVLLAFLPPLLVVVVEAIVAPVWKLLSRALHSVAIWAFGFLACLQLVRLLEPERGIALLLPMIPAVAILIAYMRWEAFRSVLSFSLLLPVLGAAFFVATVPLAIGDRAGADVQVKGATPVVMVLLDELPTSSLLRADGSIDAVRYPGFGRIARDGTWYRNATTVHEFTTQAVPAVLTGRNPKPGQLPTLGDHPENLFTLLGEAYRMNVTEPVTRLCPSRYCPETHDRAPRADRYRGLFYDTAIGYLYRVLPRSLTLDLPQIGDRWGGFGESGALRERLLGALDLGDFDVALDRDEYRPQTDFERFLASIRAGEPRRSLHFLHTKLPHAPWRFLPSGREYGNAASTDGIKDSFNFWSNDDWLVAQALQRHLLQVGYSDRLLGLLVRRLEAANLYDRALVIVTADHGASFEPGGSKRYVGRENISDVASVPLLVKYPGQRRGTVDERDARTTDIVPTIADVIDVTMPWSVDGRSLRGAPVSRRVSVGAKAGGTTFGEYAEVAAGTMATARRNARLFGQGTASMYRIGPNRGLLGTSTADYQVTRASDATARLDGETLYANVRPASGFVPARVVGEVEGTRPPHGSPLAIAVNGRIAATTRTFTLGGRSRFAALVPETVFREGANGVDVFLVEPAAGGLRLRRLGGAGRESRYALAADRRSIVLPTGKRAAVEVGRLSGQVETSTRDGGTIRIRGWAADLRDRARVDRVVVFADRRLVYASDASIYRWTIPGVSGTRGLARVGFVAELPVADVENSELRAFAVRGGVATELDWPGRDAALVAVSRTG